MRRAAFVALLAASACAPAPEARAPAVAAPVPGRPAVVGFPDGSRLPVELARTPEERERGLMFRQTMGPADGMLFVFEEEMAMAFWMKNTFVDLDMVWLDRAGTVTTVHERVPRSTPGMGDDAVATRAGRGLYVLELAAGQASARKVAVGSRLELVLPPAAP